MKNKWEQKRKGHLFGYGIEGKWILEMNWYSVVKIELYWWWCRFCDLVVRDFVRVCRTKEANVIQGDTHNPFSSTFCIGGCVN
jgi:hypothetical protein